MSEEVALRAWLQKEPFTLSMSSGFFSFFAHTGMLTALLEADCVPARVTGSSAGALVGACWASGQDIDGVKQVLFQLKKEDFWDPAPGFGLLKGDKFRNRLSEFLKVESFEDCRVPVALSAFDVLRLKTVVLDKGNLVSGIYASCAFPLLFQPIKIQDAFYLDGGIKDRPALASVRPGERVLYHHIKSRSPWRRKNSKALELPKRDNMRVIALDDIPRVGPNQLHEGVKAYDTAYRATQRLLDVSWT